MFMRVRKSLPVRSIPPAKSFTPGGGFQTFPINCGIPNLRRIINGRECNRIVRAGGGVDAVAQ